MSSIAERSTARFSRVISSAALMGCLSMLLPDCSVYAEAESPSATSELPQISTVPHPSTAPIDFNRDIRPLLATYCFECHGPDEESRQADLRLDVLTGGLESVLVPGKPEESPLIERLFSDDEFSVMPPPDSPRRPNHEQLANLREWIAQGARYETHWAFVPPERSNPPTTSNPSWVRNEIDAFVLAHLDANAMRPQPEAEPGVLARRLSMALTGLPLLPEQLQRFEAAYRADPEGAIDRWVDQLLASPAYGEHFAWAWLDAARYADTNGYQADGARVMWPWRDWLIRSLNENLPFDVMTEQMLAGDLLLPQQQRQWQSADWIPDNEASELLVASGFLRNHRYDTGSGTIPAESKFENAADRLETFGTVWMGLTFQCARCHTHKYDPIENREYYEMLSFFDKVPEVGSALKGASHPYVHVPTAEQRRELKELQARKTETESAFREACRQLDGPQTEWEQALAARDADAPRVGRGLKFQYAAEPIHFDGKRSIKKPNDPIALCAGNKKWTISFWFRPEAEENSAIFSSVEDPDRYRPGIQADWIGQRIRLRHVCRWVNSYIEFKSTEELAVGEWHHVTFQCDGRMQGLAYSASLNGLSQAMQCTHAVTNDSAGNSGKAPLILGSSPYLSRFQGDLRDLRFYDRTLEQAEISSLADDRSTTQIARISQPNRTAAERETLRLAFLESDALPADVADLRSAYFTATEQLDTAISQTPTTMVMKETATGPTHVRMAGIYDQLGETVASQTPAFLPPLPEGSANRRALAHWLVQPEHPLTARVAVNRIWQQLWGRGFVASPENFGTQCAEPMHADLLDWLATEYVRRGWDTKALIKQIVTSRTYRQNSHAPPERWQRDPQNEHLARGPRFRLPVAAVRDQALVLSGRLDDKVGGPPVVLDEVRAKDGKPVDLPYEKNDRRRTIYSFWKRNSPHPMLAVFDVADRNQCDVRVRRTNTPLHALVTLNEPGFAQSARTLAERARAAEGELTDRLQWLWRACTGRVADSEDLALLQGSLRDYRALAGSDDAAWTALCNVLLNLDATMTLE